MSQATANRCGMRCLCGTNVCLTFAPPDRIIEADGKRWTFEWHNFCGPVVLNKRGDPASIQPPERSPFWRAVTLWKRQGERVKDGLCVWEEPPGTAWINVGGRNWAPVGTELANKFGRGEPVMRKAEL